LSLPCEVTRKGAGWQAQEARALQGYVGRVGPRDAAGRPLRPLALIGEGDCPRRVRVDMKQESHVPRAVRVSK